MTAPRWTQVGFARTAAILAARAGLRFSPNRQPAAEAAMSRAMLATGCADPLELSRRAEADDEVLGAILAEVTVGETYFFREPAQLDFIRQRVLPAFTGLRTPSRPLRAWSAGCATGEEAYTLAIILREEGWGNAASVLGTDVSRPRLATADRARYTGWSLRGLANDAVERYFIRRGSHFLLRPALGATVDFRPLNLVDDGWPGAGSGIGAMDLILCRNVLIYFDRESVAEVASRLLASLSDEGWLFLGASDPMLADLVPCETVVTGAGLAYRREAARQQAGERRDSEAGSEASAALPAHVAVPGHPSLHHRPDPVRTEEPPGRDAAAGPARPPALSAPRAVSSLQAASTDPLADARARYERRDYEGAATAAAMVTRTTPTDAAAWVLLVRALANAGHTSDAEHACERALGLHSSSLELIYLHSTLLAQCGQHAAAAAAARRALYIDRTLAMAHLALGSSLARLGYPAGARRAFLAAEQELAPLAADAPVPLADGEVAHRLREAARTQRRLLDGEVA